MKKWNRQRIKNLIRRVLEFFLNPRLLLCFGIAWFITNGWSYAFAAIGVYLDITWLYVIGLSWMTFLWFPFTPEKIVTLFITIGLLRWLFPKDQKTLAVILREQTALKAAMVKAKQSRRRKKVMKWLAKELPKRRALRKLQQQK
ncbi:MAG: hypothetical protein IJX82_00775 [Clostridia bacterium]|nr:hypothetical protein [Clostridia bacterium]